MDCGSDHELLIAKFRSKLKKVGKTTRPFRYDLNQIPYDYTVEVRKRFRRVTGVQTCALPICKSKKSKDTGKLGLGVQNEAGQKLTEFCQGNALVIANTLSQQHKSWLYTWTSPDGQYQNQIDYILCSQRWTKAMQSTKTRPEADCGSDHELLIAKLNWNSDLNGKK